MHGRAAAPRAVTQDNWVVLLGRSAAAHPASNVGVAVVVFEPSVALASAAASAAATAATAATTNFIAGNAVAVPAASAVVAAATADTIAAPAAAMATPGRTVLFLIPRRRALTTVPRAGTSPFPRVAEAALGPPVLARFDLGRGSSEGVGASRTFRPDIGAPD